MPDLYQLFAGFAGLVTIASLWNLWGGELFPAERDPKGGPFVYPSVFQAPYVPGPVHAYLN
ncbi:hypothetical protein PV08_05076 [Exophiala spinifera]|uniref:Uncharacterized protein n=1 Tax=Exophiala spinifera TaxID=91928 RepID=A0A0D1YRK2_9EURO|nr:uncharacterized protein PV08_05076 [Exophiala spinifera]KIW17881.1 hypothetical protein PV08_05076 [Exophiala spinifera]